MVQNTTSGTKKTVAGLVSIVIPVFNESHIINDRIRQVATIAAGEPFEIIVADGGPGHLTLEAIDVNGIILVECESGRGIQMNAGAAKASGEFLLFLHADTDLPEGALTIIKRTLGGRSVAGAFSLSIDSDKISLAVVAWFANLRSRVERVPYGDQGQFITTALFRELGGFDALPIMEDVELFQRIRRSGLPIAVVRARVLTSSRRWESEGILRRTLSNWWLRAKYGVGVPPDSLISQYRPHGPVSEDK
jgi:rSAM/selenodomain-associated transferase 2